MRDVKFSPSTEPWFCTPCGLNQRVYKYHSQSYAYSEVHCWSCLSHFNCITMLAQKFRFLFFIPHWIGSWTICLMWNVLRTSCMMQEVEMDLFFSVNNGTGGKFSWVVLIPLKFEIIAAELEIKYRYVVARIWLHDHIALSVNIYVPEMKRFGVRNLYQKFIN